MPQPGIFKPDPTKLKNALTAVVGRAVASIKRFVSALHNKCGLVVYVDSLGRTCSTFLRRDAFSGYHFEFSSDKCIVTNKQSGDIYIVQFDKCTCPAFKFSPKNECKHLMLVAQVKGQLTVEQAIASKEPKVEECTHPKAITGLDSHYCPNCKKSIEYGTAAYEALLNRVEQIDPAKTPKGFVLKRTDDHLSMEFDVHVAVIERQRGIPTPVLKNVGRIVQCLQGIYVYKVRSGVARTFHTTQDAIAYLARVAGTSFDEIAAASEQRDQMMRKRVARL